MQSAKDGLDRGDVAWRRGDLDLALFLYVEALRFDDRTVEPLLRIAAIHEARGRNDLATRAFEMALARDPSNAGASERLGLLYLQRNENETATLLLQRAIALDAKRWRSHNGLGVLADRDAKHREAIAHYDAALALEPRAASVVNNRGYSKLLAGDASAAEADFRLAVKLGARGEVWANLARALAKQRRYAEALDALLSETEIATAYNMLGEAALANGDLARARDYFQSASEASPVYFAAAQKNLVLVNEKLTHRDAPSSGSSQ